MTADRDVLVSTARRAAENAYAPYSGFRVGAVAVDGDGPIFTGANVENAAYPSSSCAEANAVAAAASAGARSLDTVAVACIDADTVDGAYPCGRCRQIMSEFDVKRVVVTGADGSEVREHTLDELLPYRFTL
ncbi:MAG TPA: cytidine deaminase [Acidimicrobiia bacterium]|nr:cytidine deaminase [Acidimicrobiia bacterium]